MTTLSAARLRARSRGLRFTLLPTPTLARVIFAITVLLLVGFSAGSGWVLAAAAALVGLIGHGLLTRRIRDVLVTVSGPPSAAFGAQIPLTVTVTNLAAAPTPEMTLTVSCAAVGPVSVLLPPLSPGEELSTDLGSRTRLRSTQTITRYSLDTSDALGLFRQEVTGLARMNLTVTPPPARWTGRTPVAGGTLDAAVPQRQIGEEFIGLRPYRRGDSRRAVHWRSTARRGELMVIERGLEISPQTVLLLIGVAMTVEDEMQCAAAWYHVRSCDPTHRIRAVSWPLDDGPAEEVDDPAGLTRLLSRRGHRIPTVAEVLGLTEGWRGTFMVVASSRVSAAWRAAMTQGALSNGCDVFWFDDGQIEPEPEHLALTAAGLATDRDLAIELMRVMNP